MEYLQENRLQSMFNLDSKNIARVAGDIAERKTSQKCLFLRVKGLKKAQRIERL